MSHSAEKIGQLGSEGRQPKSKHQIEQTKAEQRAKLALHFFLVENNGAIKAMRSYNQHLGSFKKQGRFEELRQIEERIEKESQGRLHWFNGSLCEISDTGETLQYHDEFFPKFGQEVRSVRGFYVDFVIGGAIFKCVDLDAGRSREYFDTKNKEERRKFIKRFAERGGDTLLVENPEKLPLAFAAFITDMGRSFVIEELISYRDFPPRPQK